MYPSDPVAFGFVASLARPGGNVTGLTRQAADISGKRVQLLKEAVPSLSRVAVLLDTTEPARGDQAREAEIAARALQVDAQLVTVRSVSELDSAFAAMTRNSAGGVLLGASSMLLAHRARVAEDAVKRRLPTMCFSPLFVASGCLMSYSASFADLHRRAAYFVDKILKGAKPADLPVEQPTKFELVINLKTAKALGLTVPQSLLVRADEIIR